MTWTYIPAQLPTNTLYQVRFLLGDTNSAGQQLQDEEVNFSLSLIGSIWGAAAICCRTLATQMSRLADQTSGQSSLKYSQRAIAYAQRADEYDAILAARGTTPYAGGLSVSDMENFALNPDNVQPVFEIAMDDNTNYPERAVQPQADFGNVGGRSNE